MGYVYQLTGYIGIIKGILFWTETDHELRDYEMKRIQLYSEISFPRHSNIFIEMTSIDIAFNNRYANISNVSCVYKGDLIIASSIMSFCNILEKFDHVKLSRLLNDNISKIKISDRHNHLYVLHIKDKYGFDDFLYLYNSFSRWILAKSCGFYKYLELVFIDKKIGKFHRDHFTDIIITFSDK